VIADRWEGADCELGGSSAYGVPAEHWRRSGWARGEADEEEKNYAPLLSPPLYLALPWSAAGAWHGPAHACAWTRRTAESLGRVPAAAWVYRDGCEASVRRRAAWTPRGRATQQARAGATPACMPGFISCVHFRKCKTHKSDN
jgi:hypothetical protein